MKDVEAQHAACQDILQELRACKEERDRLKDVEAQHAACQDILQELRACQQERDRLKDVEAQHAACQDTLQELSALRQQHEACKTTAELQRLKLDELQTSQQTLVSFLESEVHGLKASHKAAMQTLVDSTSACTQSVIHIHSIFTEFVPKIELTAAKQAANDANDTIKTLEASQKQSKVSVLQAAATCEEARIKLEWVKAQLDIARAEAVGCFHERQEAYHTAEKARSALENAIRDAASFKKQVEELKMELVVMKTSCEERVAELERESLTDVAAKNEEIDTLRYQVSGIRAEMQALLDEKTLLMSQVAGK